MMLVLNPNTLSDGNASCDTIGGKALSLYRLSSLGLHIPQWFSIHSDLFKLTCGKNILGSYSEDSFTQFKVFIEQIGFLEEFDKFLKKFIGVPGKLFAVRSSASLEDSSDHSFAGLFESYLNVTKEELLKAIYKSYCDVFSSKVLSYCSINKIKTEDIKFALIIQEMIEPEFAGVCFTANPVSHDRKQSIVSSVPSLGDKLVDGTMSSNDYTLDDKGDVISQEIKHPQVDNTAVIREVTRLAKKIEAAWETAVDVEWAYKDSVYILQARPITTLKSHSFVIDNSNIVESFPGVTSPLTFSFAQKVYRTVFESSLKSLALDHGESLKASHHLIHHYRGYVFYNLTTWYQMMLAFPLAKFYIPVWEESMGIKNGLGVSKHYSFFSAIKIVFISVMRFLLIFFTLDKKAHTQETIVLAKLKRAREKFCEGKGKAPSIDDFRSLIDDFAIGWEVTLINDLYVFIFSALSKYLLSFEGPQYKRLFNEYVVQGESLESVKPLRSMVEMANYLESLDFYHDSLALDQLCQKSPDFEKMFLKHIDQYGDRSLEDLKLESMTFRQSPDLLYTFIKSLIGTKDDQQRVFSHEKFYFKNPMREALFSFFISKAKISIEIRERFRLYRSRFYGVARDYFIRIGQEMYDRSDIHDARDIFYLTMDELVVERSDYHVLIDKRKKEYEQYKSSNDYAPRYMVSDDRYDPIYPRVNKSAGIYQGTACSQGIITAEVYVVKNLDDVRDRPEVSKGKILVSPMTDPGWIYLMKNAVGLIVEKGSILSHSAIIGRELNLPTIVEVPRITEILQSGQNVTLDCYKGTITINDL